MKHKYIVVLLDGVESIFVFPCAVDHDRMFEALEAIRFGDPHNWRRKLHKLRTDQIGEIVSAGFVINGECSGESGTLGIKSRGKIDTILLRSVSE